MNDAKIIDFLNGRTFAVLMGVLLALTAAVAVTTGLTLTPDVEKGVLFSINEKLIASPWLSMAVNVAAIVSTALLMQLLNKLFSFVKSFTFVGVATFFLLQLATPITTSSLNTGSVLVLMLAVGALVLFGCYQDKQAQGPIFLIMCALSFGVMLHWPVLVLIPTFLLGFAYLRAMNWRGMLAAAIGLFTPFWIVLGLGLATPADFHLPEIDPMWDAIDLEHVRLLVGWVAFTLVLAIVTTAMNLFAIYNYRLQLRVYNTFFVMTTLLAVIAMCIDYHNLTSYLPMVNLCLSVQIAHAFTISKFPKRHFLLIALAVACIAAAASSIAL